MKEQDEIIEEIKKLATEREKFYNLSRDTETFSASLDYRMRAKSNQNKINALRWVLNK